MANSLPLLRFYYCCCLLFLSSPLLLSSSLVHGGEAGSWRTVPVRSLLPAKVCTPSKGSDPSRMEVVHRRGPCSPMDRRQKPSHLQILRQDQSRVDELHRRIRSDKEAGSLAASIPAHIGSSLGSANYIVTVGLGTPPKQLSLVFDTGSDVTWTQCRPCGSCYQQQEPLFDPSQSSTYHSLSCASTACSLLDSPGCSAATSTCQYGVVYGDNSQTTGPFVQDTLTLTPSDVLPNFLFGCGNQNSGLFFRTAGILGLGREKASLVSQAAPKYGGSFSYCLPPTSSSTGYLKLGGGAPPNVQSTPMLTDPNNPTFYFLNLVGIGVGGRPLPIPPAVFSNAGTFIDSGTVISRLPPSAYSALRSAFQQAMRSYPAAPAFGILDTCYNFTGYSTVTVPTVALQFGGGVTMNLDFSGILYVASISQGCLGFAGNANAGDQAVIGNVQQRRFNVAYDVSNRMIGFGAGGC